MSGAGGDGTCEGADDDCDWSDVRSDGLEDPAGEGTGGGSGAA